MPLKVANDLCRYPWSNGKSVNTMKLEKSFVKNERNSKINWAGNGASSYAVVNKDSPNKYGEYRGYRIAPGTRVNSLSNIAIGE